jgi:hypothetical protein
MKHLRKMFLLWLMSTRFYAWLLLRVIPFVRFTTYYTSLRGWKYQRGYKLLKAGDILLTLDRKKLTGLLNPGSFSHACQCIDKGSEVEIIEMTHHDYTHSCFFDICKEADRVVIIRCRDYDDAYIQKVIAKCKSFSNAVYDIDFDLDDIFKFKIPALYCSELVYLSDLEHRLQVNLEDLEGLGREYISPTGLYQAKNVDVIWDSDAEIPGDGQF